MRINRIVAFSLLLLVLVLPAVAMPTPPHQLRGKVFIDDAPAPDGTAVSARINGITYAATTTLNGTYGFNEPFRVLADDPDTPEKEGGKDGDKIVLYIGEKEAASTAFEIGKGQELDLSPGKSNIWLFVLLGIVIIGVIAYFIRKK